MVARAAVGKLTLESDPDIQYLQSAGHAAL